MLVLRSRNGLIEALYLVFKYVVPCCEYNTLPYNLITVTIEKEISRQLSCSRRVSFIVSSFLHPKVVQ